MRVTLIDLSKTVTLLGQRLSIHNRVMDVSKTALLNTGRLVGSNQSSDLQDLETMFNHGLVRIEDEGVILTSFSELTKVITDGSLSGGSGSVRVAHEGVLVRAANDINFKGSVLVTPTPGLATSVDVEVVGGGISVYDETTLVKTNVSSIKFVGADVLAKDVLDPNAVTVFIPPPAYLSHWNTADGANGSQVPSDSVARVTAHIATPHLGEGNPFATGGWSGTDQSATKDLTATFTTPANTTGFGGDSVFSVEVLDADGVTVIESFATPPLTGNGVFTSGTGRISVTVNNFAADSLRFQAKATVSVNVIAVLGTIGRSGGRYHVSIAHWADTATDGGVYIYNQPDVFLDSVPTGPSVATVAITETLGSIVTKHLSGLEFYTTGSQFSVDVQGINALNANTARTAGNLEIAGTEYGLAGLSQCPFGAGAASFIGWSNAENNTATEYNNTAWTVSTANYRYCGPTANVSAYARDTWLAGPTMTSPVASVLIDTYGTTSTALAEHFNDEARREDPVTFGGAGTWDSTHTLIAGEAQVFNSLLLVPNQTTFVRSDGAATPNANWAAYKPDLGGANPNYAALTAPVSYGRRFTQAAGNFQSFSAVFAGTFAAGTALADLTAGNIEIYVYRIDGLGHTGKPTTNTFPLRLHALFQLPFWDDGLTVVGSGIREGTSAGNTVNGTFGGSPVFTGFYCVIKILNPATRIDSMSVTFF